MYSTQTQDLLAKARNFSPETDRQVLTQYLGELNFKLEELANEYNEKMQLIRKECELVEGAIGEINNITPTSTEEAAG